ncbi:TonB-dependent receptor plug domain-containing protein [Sulfurimonas aquatica]|uniref:TonB-dependent receptor plug domain-containing protein n=1 Tax=Sulfurimonas aquatica TaxID=2672570 RepID=A0A975AZS3_9BACT|nr:TonB-dependent receptor [Sulfurimonas aquatica]QSZ41597.1 TonB-dependent receptor plug domain-containing protein [Sulfurimonas aquatica]
MKKLFITSILTSPLLFASGDSAMMEDFESLLNEASNIATKKSLNVDYLPSVVTVIDAQTFVDGGVLNIGEALGMLPGIQMQMAQLGKPITNIRGFKNPNSFISDKIKVLIDGVAINNEASGTSGFYMDFPLDLVEKIEILRGPASTVYGAGAFYGAVNIITKLGKNSNTNKFYWGGGSYKNMNTGGNLNTQVGDWSIMSDAYYAQNDKTLSDPDGDTTDETMENLSLGFKAKNGGFEFLTRYKSSHYGNFYSLKGDIYPNQDRGHKDTYLLSQLSYKTNIQNYKLETKFGYSNRVSDIKGYLDPDPTNFAAQFASFGLTMNEAFYVFDYQEEQNLKADVILTLPKVASNSISFGIGARQTDLIANDFSSSIENKIIDNIDYFKSINAFDALLNYFKGPEPAYYQTLSTDPTNKKIFSKTQRTILYAHIQDLIALSDSVDLVLGARVDDYSDLDTRLSSRAGLVYRANDKLIAKLLYGSAFRAPTFTEAYTNGHLGYRAGDENLKPEETNTYEASLTYIPNLNHKFSLNLYYSELYNVIDIDELTFSTPEGYQNMNSRTNKGVEFEYFFRTKKAHNLYLNASYIDAKYINPIDDNIETINGQEVIVITPEFNQDMPDISNFMFKAMYVYTPFSKLSFGTTWQYYSQTLQNDAFETKSTTVDYYQILDETITYRFSDSSKIRLSVKNLLDEEVRLPSYYYRTNGGILREGRNYHINYTYTF